MPSGKSCSIEHPDGIRRVVGGKTLAPRSKRKTETEIKSYMAWDGEKLSLKRVEVKRSLVFL